MSANLDSATVRCRVHPHIAMCGWAIFSVSQSSRGSLFSVSFLILGRKRKKSWADYTAMSNCSLALKITICNKHVTKYKCIWLEWPPPRFIYSVPYIKVINLLIPTKRFPDSTTKRLKLVYYSPLYLNYIIGSNICSDYWKKNILVNPNKNGNA